MPCSDRLRDGEDGFGPLGRVWGLVLPPYFEYVFFGLDADTFGEDEEFLVLVEVEF